MHKSYKECLACTLPYIDEVNGRNGYCDFCTGHVPMVVTESSGNPGANLFTQSLPRPEPA